MKFWSGAAVSALVLVMSLSAVAQKKDTKALLQLKDNLKRIEKSIEVTKLRMKNPQEIQFLPDLYLMLAELYADKARYMYSIKIESNPNTPAEELDFTGEKRPKLDAIESYKALIDRYPQYSALDKAMFALAHEYRELGEPDNALKVYKQIIDKFPQSSVLDESQYIVGNIYFDKKDYEFALEQYLKVIKRPVSSITSSAFYKAGMSYIQLDKFVDAMAAFNQVLALENDQSKKSDIREEALIGSVWPITELKPEELAKNPEYARPIEYYRKSAFDKASYRRVLMRLGRRFSVKTRHADAALAWYEVLRLADDSSQKREAMENFYQSFKTAKLVDYPKDSAALVAQTLWTLKGENKDFAKYEPLLRDIATTTHAQAMKRKQKDSLLQAVTAYDSYLWIFEKSKFRTEMEINKAEANFHAGHFVESGIGYQSLALRTKDPKKSKDYLSSSIQSFIESFKDINSLSNLDKVQGRHGFRASANAYLKKYPQDSEIPKITYNLGKSLYDEQNYESAVKALKYYIGRFPRDTYVKQAALLVLDCYYLRDDMKGLVQEGNALVARNPLSQDVKNEIQTVMGQAQLKNVRSIAGDFSSKDYADKFLKFAQNNKGSVVGENALLEAFTSLKANNDFKAFEVGEQFLGQFANSPKAKEVLLSMAQMALVTADYRRAAGYLGAFSQKFSSDPSAKEYAQQSALLYEQLGDSEEAVQMYSQLGQNESAARVLFMAGQWSELDKVASKLSGLQGAYYQGIATYRRNPGTDALNLLRKASQQSARDDAEKNMLGHASFIIALQELNQFKSFGKGQPFTPQLLQQKIKALQEFERQMQTVMNLGVGRWAIASLSMIGQAHLDFVGFLKNAPTPAGMTREQLGKVLSPQIANYSQSAKSYFIKCMESAESYDIFTRFVESCRTMGAVTVDESQETRTILKAGQGMPAEIDGIRKSLYKDPRNLQLLQRLAESFVRAKDFPAAFVVLSRMLEINPADAAITAQVGMVYLYMNQLDLAAGTFQESLKKDPRQVRALAGLAGMYQKFKFNKKYQQLSARLKSAGALTGIVHPWAKLK